MRLRVLTLASFSMLAFQQSGPELVIVSPAADVVLHGATVLEAELKPADTPVVDVTFYVRGERVCVVRSAPFRCQWDAGSDTTSRDLRVVAQLAGGGRAMRTMRTAAGGPSFHSTTDSVLVSAHVRDRNGRFIRGLDINQFRVLEDGTPQKILSLTPETASSEILLALDVSGSMAPALADLRSAAANFLGALRPTDSVTVAVFNTALAVVAPRTASPAGRIASLDTLRAAGGTALFDAIIQSTEIVRVSSKRRAVIVFTDGEDVSSRATATGARVALQTNDVVLYVIAQGKAANDAALKQQLEQLCMETGGAAFFGSHMNDLGRHFGEILDELTNEYVLGYVPTRPFGDGGWRTITVQMSDANLRYQVRSRQGYLAVRR